MPFIYKNKETEQYRLFGSIPIMCNAIGYDEKKQNSLSYKFSQKKVTQIEEGKHLIIKTPLERGGKNNKKKKNSKPR